MQTLGFVDLWHRGITLTRNVSFSFLYIIVGLHALHVVAGVIALLVILIRSFSIRRKLYSTGADRFNEHLLVFCRFFMDIFINFFSVDKMSPRPLKGRRHLLLK
jgi:heme/copper-type cytochrome/quinol oxidase subunit 3